MQVSHECRVSHECTNEHECRVSYECTNGHECRFGHECTNEHEWVRMNGVGRRKGTIIALDLYQGS